MEELACPGHPKRCRARVFSHPADQVIHDFADRKDRYIALPAQVIKAGRSLGVNVVENNQPADRGVAKYCPCFRPVLRPQQREAAFRSCCHFAAMFDCHLKVDHK
jgi:hypothetical protein